MRLILLVAVATLVVLPLVALAPTASAWPPACIVKEVGSEGGKLHAVAWANCGVGASVTTCPKDAFCHTVSTDPEGAPHAAETCHHTVHGHGFDTWLCVDAKGPVGCKVYSKTYRWEQGWSRSCIA